ncbi:MAG: heat-inducible transcriptional repressor HrcA [Acidimicrobiia bacterium]|nr:heat-inducible transcriptional repressor HrcA [Acidimicrobiia bacterium]
MLDERKTAILQAVVEEYIHTAEPVGSTHVAAAAGINVSSATIRNEMVQLEQQGYLHQPHTSAGRVPTDKGYRVFVDGITGAGALSRSESRTVKSFFDQAHGELEAMLHDTSRLLADLTSYTSVVVAPSIDEAEVRSVQLVPLSGHVVLVVIVLSSGAIEKRTIEVADEPDDDTVTRAHQVLSEALIGHTLGSVHIDGGRAASVRDMVAAVARALEPEPDDHVYVGGVAHMAESFDAVEQVREVLDILEKQLVVVTLLRDVLDRGLHVAIGNETGMTTLADCALVVAPYEAEGRTSGTIGVLGPARMNYPQALAAVTVVSNQLGNRLTEG